MNLGSKKTIQTKQADFWTLSVGAIRRLKGGEISRPTSYKYKYIYYFWCWLSSSLSSKILREFVFRYGPLRSRTRRDVAIQSNYGYVRRNLYFVNSFTWKINGLN